MTTLISILGVVGGALSLAAALVKRRKKPTQKQLTERAIHAARTASAQGDAAAVNAMVERTRVQKQLLIPLAAALILAAGCGCSLLPISCPRSSVSEAPEDLPPKTIVIPANRYQYPMTNDLGISGWFVPDAVHAEFMEAIILLQCYRNPTR